MSVRQPTGGEGLTLAWSAGVLVIAALMPVIGDLNGFVLPILLPGWLLAGLAILGFLLLTRKWRAAGLFAILTFLALFLAPLLSSLGAGIWNQIQFDRSKTTYAEVAAKADTLPDQGRLSGVQYRITRGPPTRIAFSLPTHAGGNLSAIVHDPSDGIAMVTGRSDRPGDDEARAALRKLRGGEVIACKPIIDHYFRCDFT